MSAGLTTLGFEAPAVTAGGGGGGPSGIRIYFSLIDTSGVYQPGIDLSASGVVQLSKDGASYANRVGSAPTSIGAGDYYYELDATEVGVDTVLLKVVKTGYAEVHTEKDMDVAQGSDVTNAVTTINATVVGALNATLAAIAAAQGAIETHFDLGLSITNGAIVALQATVDANQALLKRLLGMHGDNSLLDGGAGFPNVQYNVRRLMTGARLRVFADASALAAATPGAADGANGEIYRWSMSGTDTGAGLDATFSRSRSL